MVAHTCNPALGWEDQESQTRLRRLRKTLSENHTERNKSEAEAGPTVVAAVVLVAISFLVLSSVKGEQIDPGADPSWSRSWLLTVRVVDLLST